MDDTQKMPPPSREGEHSQGDYRSAGHLVRAKYSPSHAHYKEGEPIARTPLPLARLAEQAICAIVLEWVKAAELIQLATHVLLDFWTKSAVRAGTDLASFSQDGG